MKIMAVSFRRSRAHTEPLSAPDPAAEGWVIKNWCFWTVVLEKTLESPLDSRDTKLVIPKGNQPWIFIGSSDAETEAPVL